MLRFAIKDSEGWTSRILSESKSDAIERIAWIIRDSSNPAIYGEVYEIDTRLNTIELLCYVDRYGDVIKDLDAFLKVWRPEKEDDI